MVGAPIDLCYPDAEHIFIELHQLNPNLDGPGCLGEGGATHGEGELHGEGVTDPLVSVVQAPILKQVAELEVDLLLNEIKDNLGVIGGEELSFKAEDLLVGW